jgi:hypothetical protein
MATNMQMTVEKVPGSANAETNKSKIKIAVTINTSGGSYNADGDTTGAVLIDDKEVASLDGKKFYKNTSTEIYSGTKSVQHEEDGSKTVTVKAVFDTMIAAEVLTEEKTLKLPQISRSSMKVPAFVMGKEGTLVITPLAEGMEHEVLYAFGSKSGTAVARTKNTTVTWTPPEELAEEIPKSASGVGTLTLKSYKDGVSGSRNYEFTARVGKQASPELSGESAEITKTFEGAALKGRSRLTFSAEATAKYGASIQQKGFSFGRKKADKLSGEILLEEAGSFAPTWTVTDSRGSVTAVSLRQMSVFNYSAPQLKSPDAYRCREDGSRDDGGAFLAVISGVTYSNVLGNEGWLEMRRRTAGGSWGSWERLEKNQLNVRGGFLENQSYEVEVAATDTVGERKSVVYTIPTAAVAFVLEDGGKAAGFGKYPEQEGLDIAWDIHMNGQTIGGLRDPVSAQEAATKAYVDAAIAAALEALNK